MPVYTTTLDARHTKCVHGLRVVHDIEFPGKLLQVCGFPFGFVIHLRGGPQVVADTAHEVHLFARGKGFVLFEERAVFVVAQLIDGCGGYDIKRLAPGEGVFGAGEK